MLYKMSETIVTKSIFTERYAKFCELLSQLRHERDFSQASLAEQLNRPQSFVSKYERGERRLDVVEFLEVCSALEADPCELILALVKG